MISTGKHLSKLVSLLLLAAATILSSCSKDRDDNARALLSTVPSSAGVVALIDCRSLIEKAGGPQAITELVRKHNNNAKTQQTLESINKAWNPDYAVLFSDGYRMYLTTTVDDPGALREALDKNPETKLSDLQGVVCNTSLAMVDGQIWLLLSNGSIDPVNIKGYKALSENRSFASSDYADPMIEQDDDIRFLADVSTLISMDGGNAMSQQSLMSRMIMSAIFKDGVYVAGEVTFDKGAVLAEARVLDSKYHTAEFLLPLSKIDIATLQATAPQAATIAALGASRQLVDKIKSVGQSLGGMLPGDLLNMLAPLDGTVAMAISSTAGDMRGIVTINDNNPTALREALTQGHLTVTREGNRLLLSEGAEPQGTLDVKKQASLFKGAIAGVVSSDEKSMGVSSQQTSPFSLLSVMLYNSDNGLQLKIRLDTRDPKANALKAILRQAQ